MKKIILNLALLMFLMQNTSAIDQYAERNLSESLFQGYDKYRRPERLLNIAVQIQLKQIVQLDEKNQIMITSFHLTQLWRDTRLTWNPGDYSNISAIPVPISNLWIPDTFIMNTADDDGYIRMNEQSFSSISWNGYVYFSSPAQIKTSCTLSVKNYPFDKQNCSIILSFWSHDQTKVKFNASDSFIDTNDFTRNPIWDLTSLNFNVYETSEYFLSQKLSFSNVKIDFLLKRKPLYMMVNGVLPCLFLNLITLISYLIPYSSQITLSMTCFLTYSVNGVRISEDIPAQSDVFPVITVFFYVSMLHTLASMLWFVIYNYLKVKEKMPERLLCVSVRFQEIGSKISKIIFMRKNVSANDTTVSSNNMDLSNLDSSVMSSSSMIAEKQREASRKEYEKKCEIFNYFVLFMSSGLMLLTQLGIWLSISL